VTADDVQLLYIVRSSIVADLFAVVWKFEKSIIMLSDGGRTGSLFSLFSFEHDIKTDAPIITRTIVFEISFFIFLVYTLKFTESTKVEDMIQ